MNSRTQHTDDYNVDSLSDDSCNEYKYSDENENNIRKKPKYILYL